MSLLKLNKLSRKHSLIKAKKLFEEGLEEMGISRKEFVLHLSHSNIPRHVKLAEFFKFSWEKVFNISVSLRKSDWPTFYNQIRSGDYDIGGYSAFATYNDPTYFMSRFENEKVNFASWENLDFQKYMNLAKDSISNKRRNHYLRLAESILMEEMPVIPIYNHTHLYLQKSSLKNLLAPKLAYADFKWAYFDE